MVFKTRPGDVIELDYEWVNGPDCDPDDYCALVTPRVIKSSPPSNRRKKGQRIRKPVVAVEPAPNRLALTVPEVAWLLNCSPNKAWGLIKSGTLKSFKLGSKRLVSREAVEALMDLD